MKMVGRAEHVRLAKDGDKSDRKIVVVKPHKSKREGRLSYHRVMVVNHHGKFETLVLTPLEYKKAVSRGGKNNNKNLHITPGLFQYIIKWFLHKFHS